MSTGSDPLHAAAQVLGAHHPTWRHGQLLFDLIVEGLGPLAVVDAADGGAARWLYRRVSEGSAEIVPWPVAVCLAQALEKGIVPLTDDEGESWRASGDSRARTSRLRGLRPGRIKFCDGRQSLELGYGEDGQLKERCINGLFPGRLAGIAEALAGHGAAPAERAASFVVRLDQGRHGPGRVRMPVAIPGGVASIWQVGRSGARRALFDGRVPPSARYVVVDGVSATAVGWGATPEEAQAAYEAEVRREQPQPHHEVQTITDDYDDDGNLIARGDPGPLSAEGPEAGGEPDDEPMEPPSVDPITGRVDLGMFVVRGPASDVPMPALTLESTPSVVVPLDPSPASPPPLGRWVRTIGALGSTRHAARVKSGDGFLLIGEHVLAHVERARLLAQLDEADERRAAMFGGESLGNPEHEPFVRYEAVAYLWEPAHGDEPARFTVTRSARGPRFDAADLEGDEIAHQVRRQVRVRRGSRP